MVLGHDGDRHCINSLEYTALQCSMAILDLCGHLRYQCPPLHHRMYYQLLAIYAISGDLRSYDRPFCAVNVYWDVPHGLDYNYQHVLFRLRPSVG